MRIMHEIEMAEKQAALRLSGQLAKIIMSRRVFLQEISQIESAEN